MDNIVSIDVSSINVNANQQANIMICPDVLAHIVQYCYMNIVRRSNALAAYRHVYSNELLVRASAKENNMFASLALVCQDWYQAVLDFIRGPDYIAYYERRCLLSKYIHPRRFVLMNEIGNMSFFGNVRMSIDSSILYRYSITWSDYNQEFLKRSNQKIIVTFMGSDLFKYTRLIFIGPAYQAADGNPIALYKSTIARPWSVVHIKGCKCCSKNNSDDHVANADGLAQALYRAIGRILQDCPEFCYVFNIMFKAAAIVADMSKEPASADDMAALAALI
jgi:hypothetical protein